VLVLLFVTMLGLAAAQIVLRNVFASGLFWADELVRLLVLWVAIVGAIAATRDRRHIAIELIVRSLPPLLRRIVRSLVGCFAAGVAGVFAVQTWLLVADSREFGETVLGDWPAWHFQVILPIGFFLIAIQFLLATVAVWLEDEP